MPALHTLEVGSREIIKPQLDLGGVDTLLDFVDNQPFEEVFIHGGRPGLVTFSSSLTDRTVYTGHSTRIPGHVGEVLKGRLGIGYRRH
jgi:hypothetical protein